MKKCSITGKTTDLFSLELEGDEGEFFTVYINGSAWDAIAEIAKMAMSDTVQHLQDQIDDQIDFFD